MDPDLGFLGPEARLAGDFAAFGTDGFLGGHLLPGFCSAGAAASGSDTSAATGSGVGTAALSAIGSTAGATGMASPADIAMASINGAASYGASGALLNTAWKRSRNRQDQ